MPLRIRTGALWSIAIGLALIAGIWTAIYLQDSRDDQNDRRIAEMSATNLATVFEAHVSDIFTAIDRVILYSREEYAANGYINERFRDHLFSRVFPGSLVQISVLDRDGRLAYSSRSEAGVGKQDFSSAEYFAHQRDAGDDHLYISKPVQDAITGKWIIQCVCKLRDSGEFAGVVVFSMDAMSFLAMHSSLDVGKEGAITLLGMDGVIRARLSYGGTRSQFFGLVLPSSRPFFDPSQPASGIYLTTSAVDGVRRIGAWRRLPKVPMVVLVLLSEAEIFAPHRDREMATHWLGVALTLVILGGAGLIAFLLSKNAESAEALEKQAITDPLTGLANRRHFYSRLAGEFDRARRYGRPLSVIMLDLDLFKGINDTYGHAAGDAVLRTVSERCGRVIRKQDLLGRIGGEEFCVFLPETTEDHAVTVAEALRQVLAGEPVPVDQGKSVAATASFGVATVVPEDRTFESLLSRADAALYAAKGKGRNRVQAESGLQGPKEAADALRLSSPALHVVQDQPSR